jgi:hypothetical protein
MGRITPNTQQTLYDFGAKSFVLLNTLSEGIAIQSKLYIESLNAGNPEALKVFRDQILDLILSQKENVLNLKNNTLTALQNYDRSICVELLENFDDPNYFIDIRKSYKSAQKHELLKCKRDLDDFGNNWLRNQVLSHRQAETTWHLLHSALGLAAINETIKAHLDDSLLDPQRKKLEVLSKAAEALAKNGNKGIESATIKKVNELASGASHVNFTNLFEEEEKRSIGISQDAPKTVELMSPDSFNLLFKEQGDAVETIPVNLFSIQNHIIQSDYLAPLQNILQQLEESYNQHSEQIYNSANHISQLINELKKEQNTKENAILIREERNNIDSHVAALNTLADSFSLELSTNLRQAQDNLDIRTIINSAELLSKAASRPVIKSRFQEWQSRQADTIKNQKNRIVDFINKHKQEIDTLKFDEQHNTYFNKIEQAGAFIESHKIYPQVSELLPFYYKKLFTGSHLAGAGNFRSAEYVGVSKALDMIKAGTSGAIMIIGESMSGKTYLSEGIAKTLYDLEKYDVNPPENQSYTGNDLHIAFQKLFGKKGTGLTILNQLKKSRVFIFNDIERWWTRSTNGSKSLDYLAELIEKVGNKHFFILNSNKYSYQIIKETTQLEKKLLATIIVRPSSSYELKNIVFNRHKIGGAEVYYRKDLVRQSNKITELIHEIHGQSMGNVGVALHLWLTGIRLSDAGELRIGKPKVLPFPSINNPHWKLLLYHFILHRKLSEPQLKEIFIKDGWWPQDILFEMEKSGLVFKQPDGNYQLNTIARFYIEKWLKTLSFLN